VTSICLAPRMRKKNCRVLAAQILPSYTPILALFRAHAIVCVHVPNRALCRRFLVVVLAGSIRGLYVPIPAPIPAPFQSPVVPCMHSRSRAPSRKFLLKLVGNNSGLNAPIPVPALAEYFTLPHPQALESTGCPETRKWQRFLPNSAIGIQRIPCAHL